MKYGDMVAIVIVSYNSESTIIETLDSAFFQNYPNLELIISDDCSTDSTALKAKKWIEQHKDRFLRAKLIVNEENLGISKNANFAYREVKAEWIKGIAADDLLEPDAIKNNVEYVVKNRINTVLFSDMMLFKENNGKKVYFNQDEEEKDYIKKVSVLPAAKQYKKLIKREILCSPTLFINKGVFWSVGGYDERFRNLEDWPLKINLTKNNYKINYMNKITVDYRIGNSVSHLDKSILNVSHIAEIYDVKSKLCYPNISRFHFIYYLEELIIKMKNFILIKIMKNKRNKMTELINLIFNLCLPRKWKKIFFRMKGVKHGSY